MVYDPHKGTRGFASLEESTSSGNEDEGLGGRVFYVSNDTTNLPEGGEVGADVSSHGQSPLHPFATIDHAINQCKAGRGDKIICLPGHAEVITTAITLDVAGVTIEGRGRGASRAQISCATASIDVITVTAADCKIQNLLFNEVTAAVNSLINIAAADLHVVDCQFDVGASNTNPCLTHASGARFVFENNRIHVTADGPNEFYSAETAVDGCQVINNYFDGGSTANSFDDAFLDLGSLVVTDMLVKDNIFIYGTALVGTGNALVHMYGNRFLGLCIPKAGIPLTIYCDPSGSTEGEGTAEDPTTLANAITNSTAGSRILLNPGTYTLTADQALNTANMTIEPVGYIPGASAKNVIITSATDGNKLFVVTAAGCTIRGLRCTHTGTETSQNPMIDINSGGDQTLIYDCEFDMADVANVEGVDIATGTADNRIINCKFIDPNAGESCVLNAGAQTEIAGCRFDLAGGDGLAIEELASPGVGTHIHHNVFSGDGTDQAFISWTSSPSVGAAVHHNVVTEAGTTNNWFGDDTDLDTVVVECYAAGGAAGATTVVNPSVT